MGPRRADGTAGSLGRPDERRSDRSSDLCHFAVAARRVLPAVRDRRIEQVRQYTCVSGCGTPDYLVMLPVAVAILSVAGLLFWLAFRRRSPAPGEGPQTP